MAVRRVQDSTNSEYAIETDDAGTILSIQGPWPERPGFEFDLTVDHCEFAEASNVPQEVRASAEARGLQVCYYDPVHCRTCYCDAHGKVLRCVGHC